MKRDVEVREAVKDRYRTCCTVFHIKFGTAVLGVIEALVSIGVLISATQQVVWKNGGSHNCMENFLRDCLIFQFSHFSVTLTFDYILIILMIFILLSIFLLFCGILFDTSCLLLPHILIQGIFLLFSVGYFCLYAISYFYGDLHMHSRNFEVNRFLERMWLATLLLALAGFQSYLFSAVIRCSMYISGIEDIRRRRESEFERCSERVRLAKENGLWRTTSWGGGFQQYKGEYDGVKKKKSSKEKGIHVQWSIQRQTVGEDDEPTVQIQNYKPQPEAKTSLVETVDETKEAGFMPKRVNQQRRRSSETSRKEHDLQTPSLQKHSSADTVGVSHTTEQASSTSKITTPKARSDQRISRGERRESSSSASPQRRHSEKGKRWDHDRRSKRDTEQGANVVSTPTTKSKHPASHTTKLQKQKSVDSEYARGDHRNRSDSRRSSLGNECSATGSSGQQKTTPTQPNEKRHDIPHIKRVSITATHL